MELMVPLPVMEASVLPLITETPTATLPAFACASALDSITDFANSLIPFFVDVRSLFFTRTMEEALATFTATPIPTPWVLIFSSLTDSRSMVSAVRVLASISMIVSIFLTLAI